MFEVCRGLLYRVGLGSFSMQNTIVLLHFDTSLIVCFSWEVYFEYRPISYCLLPLAYRLPPMGRPPRGAGGGGRPPWGPGGSGRPPRGHRRRRGGREGASPDRLYKAPTDYTKPQKSIQNLQKTIQSRWILDTTPKH